MRRYTEIVGRRKNRLLLRCARKCVNAENNRRRWVIDMVLSEYSNLCPQSQKTLYAWPSRVKTRLSFE